MIPLQRARRSSGLMPDVQQATSGHPSTWMLPQASVVPSFASSALPEKRLRPLAPSLGLKAVNSSTVTVQDAQCVAGEHQAFACAKRKTTEPMSCTTGWFGAAMTAQRPSCQRRHRTGRSWRKQTLPRDGRCAQCSTFCGSNEGGVISPSHFPILYETLFIFKIHHQRNIQNVKYCETRKNWASNA